MFEIISSLFTAALGGGASGLLGVFITKHFEQKKTVSDLQKLKMQLESSERIAQQEREHAAKMAQSQQNTDIHMAELRAEEHADEQATKAQIASYESDAPRFTVNFTGDDKSPWSVATRNAVTLLMGTVDVLRGLVRPVMTVYVLYLLTAVFLWVKELYARQGVVITAAEVKDLALQCVQTIFFLVTGISTWWFGIRPSQGASRKE